MSSRERPDHADALFARLLAGAGLAWGVALGSLVGSWLGYPSAGAVSGGVAACVLAFVFVLPIRGRHGLIGSTARAAILVSLPLGMLAAWFALPQ